MLGIFPHFFSFFFDEGVKIENVVVFFCFFCVSVELVLVFRIILGPKIWGKFKTRPTQAFNFF